MWQTTEPQSSQESVHISLHLLSSWYWNKDCSVSLFVLIMFIKKVSYKKRQHDESSSALRHSAKGLKVAVLRRSADVQPRLTEDICERCAQFLWEYEPGPCGRAEGRRCPHCASKEKFCEVESCPVVSRWQIVHEFTNFEHLRACQQIQIKRGGMNGKDIPEKSSHSLISSQDHVEVHTMARNIFAYLIKHMPYPGN